MNIANGFEYELNEDNLDNWELLEAIDEVEDNPERIVRVAKLLLGEADYARLKDFCRVNGRVSMSKMNEAVVEILKGDKTKN